MNGPSAHSLIITANSCSIYCPIKRCVSCVCERLCERERGPVCGQLSDVNKSFTHGAQLKRSTMHWMWAATCAYVCVSTCVCVCVGLCNIWEIPALDPEAFRSPWKPMHINARRKSQQMKWQSLGEGQCTDSSTDCSQLFDIMKNIYTADDTVYSWGQTHQ